jgi:hypothetical protein
MNQLINSNIEKLRHLFITHQVNRAYIFGSVLSDRFGPESDLDFLVRFNVGLAPLEKGDLWWSLHDSLRDVFRREIDLLTEDSLKNPFLIAEINKTRKLIYGEPD